MSETKHDIQPGDVVRLKPIKIISIRRDRIITRDPVLDFSLAISSGLIESVEPRPLEVE